MSIDLYDREIVTVTNLMMQLNEMARNTRSTPKALRDFGLRIQDMFYQAGFVVNVDMSAAGLINPKTGRTFPPDVEILSRVDDMENLGEFDHDEKRFEVLDSKVKGEKYRGLRETVNKPRNAR